jgi:hypothetical protein
MRKALQKSTTTSLALMSLLLIASCADVTTNACGWLKEIRPAAAEIAYLGIDTKRAIVSHNRKVRGFCR